MKKIATDSKRSLRHIELHGKQVKSDTSVANFLTCFYDKGKVLKVLAHMDISAGWTDVLNGIWRAIW